MSTFDEFDLGPKYEGIDAGNAVRWDDLRFPVTAIIGCAIGYALFFSP